MDFVKKTEGVRRYEQAKSFAKNPKIIDKFHGSYSIGLGRHTIAARQIKSTLPSLIGGNQEIHSGISFRIAKYSHLHLEACRLSTVVTIVENLGM